MRFLSALFSRCVYVCAVITCLVAVAALIALIVSAVWTFVLFAIAVGFLLMAIDVIRTNPWR